MNSDTVGACEQTKDKKPVNPEPIGYGRGEQPILTYYGKGYVPLWNAENMYLGIHLKGYDKHKSMGKVHELLLPCYIADRPEWISSDCTL